MEGHAQVGFCDVEHRLPRVEALGCEYLVVLGQTQSRQTVFQVAHVGRRGLRAWEESSGSGRAWMGGPEARRSEREWGRVQY